MALAATEILPFHRSLIEEEEISAVLEVLRGGWLTSGPRVKEFEAAFANYIGASHAIAFNSCTAGSFARNRLKSLSNTPALRRVRGWGLGGPLFSWA